MKERLNQCSHYKIHMKISNLVKTKTNDSSLHVGSTLVLEFAYISLKPCANVQS